MRSILLCNLFHYGHFLVYAEAFTRWALSRGMHVRYLGPEAPDSTYRSAFRTDPRVTFSALPPCPDGQCPDIPYEPSPAMAPWLIETVRAAQDALRPDITLLLNADELLFNDRLSLSGDVRFPTPTAGVTTFGHRERYTLVDEPYARHLRECLEASAPFYALLTLDEYHAAALTGPGLRPGFMPDVFRRRVQPGGAAVAPQGLDGFLQADTSPVIPLLGKFDRRKNPLWILRQVLEHPGACAVILGQRVPDPEDDPEIEAILSRLDAQGRLFARFGFVEESWFHLVLASPRVRAVPLPYTRHFGSSGIELMAHAHGLPVLVPDDGLMGRRVCEHGLGLTYHAGNAGDFASRFRLLQSAGPGPFRAAMAGFMESFTWERFDAALDRWLLSSPGPDPEESARLLAGRASAPQPGRSMPEEPLPGEEPRRAAHFLYHQAMDAALAGDTSLALERMAASQALDGPSPGRDLRQAMLLWRLGRAVEGRPFLERAMAAGLDVDFAFVLNHHMDAAIALFEDGHLDQLVPLLPALADFFSMTAPPVEGNGPEADPAAFWRRTVASGRWIGADYWQMLGIFLARTDKPNEGVECFRKAIALDPSATRYRLNECDALRYAGRFDESRRAVEALAALAPEEHGIHHKRGQVLLAQHRPGEAMAEFSLEPPESPFHAAAMANIPACEEMLQADRHTDGSSFA